MKKLLFIVSLFFFSYPIYGEPHISHEEVCMDMSMAYSTLAIFRDQQMPLERIASDIRYLKDSKEETPEMVEILTLAAYQVYVGEYRSLTPQQINVTIYKGCMAGVL